MERGAEMLRAMEGKIPSLRSIEVGLNDLKGDDDFHLVLITRFDSPEGLQDYKVHPVHKEIIAFFKDATTDRAPVDFPSTE